MKWTVYFVLAAAACQSGEAKEAPANTTIVQLPRPAVTDGYRADFHTLCDVVHLSGADQRASEERWPIIAMYLGQQIKTDEAHDFLVAIQPLAGEAKALALETESRRVGLSSCPLVAEWRTPAGS